MTDDTLLTLLALSRRLSLPARWLKAEAEAARLPCLRVGRQLLFHLPAVVESLQQRASAKPQEAPARA